jgi:glycine cleavage system H protein
VYRKFTQDHEWIEFNSETKIATIGVTDHAQQELGDIVHVELPEIGTTFDIEESLCSIESTKTAADVYAPSGGEIIEVN